VTSKVANRILVSCAVVITAAVVHRELPPRTTDVRWDRSNMAGALRAIAELPSSMTSHRMLGSPDADVTVIAFSDFTCPYCAELATNLTEILKSFEQQVAVSFFHFPLDAINPHAVPAAIASECAAQQGRFAPFHDVLFAQQVMIGRKPWLDFAEAAGIVDIMVFDDCLTSEPARQAVERDREFALRIGLPSSPVVVIGSDILPGAQSVEVLRESIHRAMAARRN
jgi:protein-disulfide isomerase